MTTPNGTTAHALPADWPAAVDRAVDEFETYIRIEVDPLRMYKGIDLAAKGAVQCYDDGTAVVTGTTQTYEILDRCPCKDATFRGSAWCKHAIAVWLTKHAWSYVTQPATPAPEPAPATGWQQALPPSTITMKWRVDGVDMSLTLRDATDDGLYQRMGRVLPTIRRRIEEEKARRQG